MLGNKGTKKFYRSGIFLVNLRVKPSFVFLILFCFVFKKAEQEEAKINSTGKMLNQIKIVKIIWEIHC
jgi:hypothetical protein